jgi:hypothetical protein
VKGKADAGLHRRLRELGRQSNDLRQPAAASGAEVPGTEGDQVVPGTEGDQVRGVEPPGVGQRVDPHDGLNQRAPPREVECGAQCRGDRHPAGRGDLVRLEHVPPDEQPLPCVIPARHHHLGRCVGRPARRAEQFGRREAAQHAAPRDQEVGGSRPESEGDLGVGGHIDPVNRRRNRGPRSAPWVTNPAATAREPRNG